MCNVWCVRKTIEAIKWVTCGTRSSDNTFSSIHVCGVVIALLWIEHGPEHVTDTGKG